MTAASPLPLAGQHAVVTGGGSGIGAAVAEELARQGADLTLIGRREDRLAARVEVLRAVSQVRMGASGVDVTDPSAVEEAFASAAEQRGRVTILVNNAGAAFSAPFARTDLDRWRALLDVNLMGAVFCTRAIVAPLAGADYGRVVNIASTAGLRGYRYVTAYSAAKHALIGFTRSLALELAATGITVNAVCPGFTDTDLVAEAVATIVERTGRTEESARAELANINPQRRLIEPWEVARVVGWLCLPESRSITGQAIVVAGGEVT